MNATAIVTVAAFVSLAVPAMADEADALGRWRIITTPSSFDAQTILLDNVTGKSWLLVEKALPPIDGRNMSTWEWEPLPIGNTPPRVISPVLLPKKP